MRMLVALLFFAIWAGQSHAKINCDSVANDLATIELMRELDDRDTRAKYFPVLHAPASVSLAERLATVAYFSDAATPEKDSYSALKRIMGVAYVEAAEVGFTGNASRFAEFMCAGFATHPELSSAFADWEQDSAVSDKRAIKKLDSLVEVGLTQAQYIKAHIYMSVLSHRDTYYFDRGYAPEGLRLLTQVWEANILVGESLLTVSYPYHIYNNCLSKSQRQAYDKRFKSADVSEILDHRDWVISQNPTCKDDYEIYDKARAQLEVTKFLSSEQDCVFPEKSERSRVCSILRGKGAGSLFYYGQTSEICKAGRENLLSAAEAGDKDAVKLLILISNSTNPTVSYAPNTAPISNCFERRMDAYKAALEAGIKFDPTNYGYMMQMGLLLESDSPTKAASFLYNAATLALSDNNKEHAYKVLDLFIHSSKLQATPFYGKTMELFER